jgi:hypothetical protein
VSNHEVTIHTVVDDELLTELKNAVDTEEPIALVIDRARFYVVVDAIGID